MTKWTQARPQISSLAAVMALFAMLCQSLLPTIIYHQTSSNPLLLQQISRAFSSKLAALDQADRDMQGHNESASAPHDHHFERSTHTQHAMTDEFAHEAAYEAAHESDLHGRPGAHSHQQHQIHCAMCLADLMPLALPSWPFISIPVPLLFTPRYFVFASVFFPLAIGTPLARGPPPY